MQIVDCRMLQLVRQAMMVVHVRQHVPIDVLCCLCIRGIASPLSEGIELHPKRAILCQGHKGPMQARCLLAGLFQGHLVVWNTFNKHNELMQGSEGGGGGQQVTQRQTAQM